MCSASFQIKIQEDFLMSFLSIFIIKSSSRKSWWEIGSYRSFFVDDWETKLKCNQWERVGNSCRAMFGLFNYWTNWLFDLFMLFLMVVITFVPFSNIQSKCYDWQVKMDFHHNIYLALITDFYGKKFWKLAPLLLATFLLEREMRVLMNSSWIC